MQHAHQGCLEKSTQSTLDSLLNIEDTLSCSLARTLIKKSQFVEYVIVEKSNFCNIIVGKVRDN